MPATKTVSLLSPSRCTKTVPSGAPTTTMGTAASHIPKMSKRAGRQRADRNPSHRHDLAA